MKNPYFYNVLNLRLPSMDGVKRCQSCGTETNYRFNPGIFLNPKTSDVTDADRVERPICPDCYREHHAQPFEVIRFGQGANLRIVLSIQEEDPTLAWITVEMKRLDAMGLESWSQVHNINSKIMEDLAVQILKERS